MKLTYSFLSIVVPTLLGIIPAKGNTYYFSSMNGDDSRSSVQARQSATPWRSLNKLNQVFGQLQPGDSVLFKRGDVFYGSIVAGQSGVAGNPIVFAAYGQGGDPIISGFSKLAGWKSAGNGIWQSPCQGCGMRVNMVTIADTVQHMGRYPNTGYLTVQSHTAKTGITDNSLAGGPDWTGAELVIRKNRYTIDRSTITGQQGAVLTYTGTNFYAPMDKFGYFIQNDIRTLDQNGEWYYDPKGHTMNIYFGSANPPGEVLASSIDTLVSIRNRQYLVFTGLAFSGSNGNAFSLGNSSNITISNCRILFSSLDAVSGTGLNNVTLAGLFIDHTDDNGINIFGNGNMVTDCTIRHTGNIPGAGNGEHSYIGINLGGSNNTVIYNTVDTTGYVGIFFLGGPNTIKNNTVDYFCYVKDDGGGIYTWSGDIDSATPRRTGIITGNIVLNGVTAPDGSNNVLGGIAIGIYLDENAGEVEASNNTVAHCTSGIFLQGAHEVVVKGNTLYDNGSQISLRRDVLKGTLRNNDISDNVAVGVRPEQTMLVMSSAVSGDVSNFVALHDNHYAQVGGATFFKTVVRQNNNNVQDKGALSDFQSRYGKESNSVVVPPAGSVRFEYNSSKKAKVVTLDRGYKNLGGKSYLGQLTLQPYTSEVLIPQ
jgi:parallel beta-helix repeat protein